MRKIIPAALVCIAALASPASAQAVGDDARCFLLSNAFATKSTDPKARALAASSLTYYLGRLDGRATPGNIADTIRRLGPTIDPKTAGAQMSACAARMARSEQAVQAAVRANAPAR